MNTLEWNWEFLISAEIETEYGLKKISTAKGKGFITKSEAERQAKKLKHEGYKNIKISFRKWTE